MIEKHKIISFLLGAGISLNAGAPSTKELTDVVLKAKDIRKHTDQSFYFSNRHDPVMHSEKIVKLIQETLSGIKIRILNYYKKLGKENFGNKRMMNYENLYYFIWQLWSSGSGEYDNPVPIRVFNEINKRFIPKLDAISEDTFYNYSLTYFLEDILRYIEDITSLKLQINLEGEHIKSIHEAYYDDSVANINIFSLNHDTLIEQSFNSNNINYCDGFLTNDPKMSIWNPETFEHNRNRVNLYKLHGSINWFRFKRKKEVMYFVGKVSDEVRDLDDIKDSDGDYLVRHNRHLLLIGTFNKMFDYLSNIFIEIHYRFFNSLQNINNLIISGYSFNDKGINFNLVNWMESDLKNRIIIINQNPDEVKYNSRGMIIRGWTDWASNGRLKTISKKFEEVRWEELKSYL